MITKQWIISAMENYPKADNLDNVVFLVHWRRQASEVDGEKTWSAETYGAQTMPAPSPEDYTPYEDLTFEQVCGWLEASMDVAVIDQALEANIEEQKNPKVIQSPLPWVTPESVELMPESIVATDTIG